MTDEPVHAKAQYTPIPQPKETWLVGNILDVEHGQSIRSLCRISRVYGGIFQMRVKQLIAIASSQELAHYCSDEDK